MLKQTAVYWGPPVSDGDGGETFPSPVEIKCRWEDVEGNVVDPTSNATTSNSLVYVDRDVLRGGYLYLGGMSGLSGTPVNIVGARRIEGVKKTPNFRATEHLREVTL
jgi:hypothetical protein